MRLSDFDYGLPAELIAQQPAEPRDSARLMVVRRASSAIEHHIFRDITAELRAGDLLVVNDSRVLQARLFGHLAGTGGRVEVLLLRDAGDGGWEVMARPARRLRPGRLVRFESGGEQVEARVEAVQQGGERLLRFPAGINPERFGVTPLPPYITAPLADAERYQTVYARAPGSAAAPTAGLHFTPALLERLRAAGVATAAVTLHIGPGTFRPVTADDPRRHEMHAEYYQISEETAAAIRETRARGGRVVAAGTTSVRVLEQVAADLGEAIGSASGWTRIFMYPGYRFRLVDALITNFHLPRSTLLMLVSAFAGRELVLRAYQEAVTQRYRFYSFGDAMFIC